VEVESLGLAISNLARHQEQCCWTLASRDRRRRRRTGHSRRSSRGYWWLGGEACLRASRGRRSHPRCVMLLICPSQNDRLIEGCGLFQGDIHALGLAQSCHKQLDLLRLGYRMTVTRKGHDPVVVLIHGAGAAKKR
jgi:hypothetical protein